METKSSIKNKAIGRRLISGGIYKDMFRQLSITAVILLSIAVIIGIAGIISSYTSWQSYKREEPTAYAEFIAYDSIANVSPVLSLYMFLFAIIPFAAFSFLNKRAGSDFYHSIPTTRTALFSSVFLASFTWAVIIIIATLAVQVAGCAITGMIFHYSYLMYLIPTYIIGALLIISIASIALSITGTRFSNVILFGLILFLPRLIFAFCSAAVVSETVIVPSSDMGIFLNASYNLPVGMFLSTFGVSTIASMDIETLFMNYGTMLYSLILGVVYAVFAGVCFNLRKSETAGMSAENKILQTCYRCAISLPTALVVTVLIMFGEGETEAIIVLSAITILIFCIFELICSKSFKSLLKALPSFLIVIALCGAFVLGTKLVVAAKLSYQPDADEIASISIPYEDDGMAYAYELNYNAYMASKVKIGGEEIRSIVSDALKESVRLVKENPDMFRGKDTMMDIIFNKKGGGKCTRTVLFTDLDYVRLNELIQENKEYVGSYTKLPLKSEIVSAGIRANDMGISGKLNAKNLFEVYRSEYSKLTFDQIQSLNSSGNIDLFITVNGKVDEKTFNCSYSVSPELTPKTAKEIICAINEKYKGNKLEEAIESWYAFADLMTKSNLDEGMDIMMNADFSFRNLELIGSVIDIQEGCKVCRSNFGMNMYMGGDEKGEEALSDEDIAKAMKVAELLKKGELTEKPGKYTVKVVLWGNCYSYQESYDKNNMDAAFYINLNKKDYLELFELVSQEGNYFFE